MTLTGLLVAALAATGCQVLGPTAISSGRSAYSDVIARTNSEQTLALIVRMRYADPIMLMTVSNITASLKFTANGGVQVGAGPESAYAGNLVPISAGASYEDNPTISYAPVSTDAFVRDWLSPVQLETLVLALQGSRDPEGLLVLLASQMNGLRSTFEGSSDPGFERAATLLAELRDKGCATWGRSPAAADSYVLSLSRVRPEAAQPVAELLGLLGLESMAGEQPVIQIPIQLGVHRPGEAKLAIQTRSVAELVQAASTSVLVPEAHVAEGVVGPNPPANTPHPIFEVRSSKERPTHAAVAIQHRGYWFYVDDTDLRSKHNFRVTEMLFFMRLSDAERGTQTAPVLTLPVG